MSGITEKEVKALEDALAKKSGEIVEACQKAMRDETQKFDAITQKTNEKLTELAGEGKKLSEQLSEVKGKLTEVEQKVVYRPAGDSIIAKSVGQIFTESEELKFANTKGQPSVQPVNVGNIHRKTAMINASGQNQPLVPDQRVGGIITAPNRRLTIRDLLPQLTTNSNLVQFASENVFTNNAGPQFSSPNDKENVLKNESGITFTLSNAAVATIAHWIPASRQLLADAAGLQAYIDSRLMYGLKLEEEEQILLGDGTGGNLSGVYTNGTTYNRGVSNDTRIDCLLKAMLQVALSEYVASGIVVNPIDWTAIQLIKDTTGRYIFADPQAMAQPRMWGLPVVATNTMSEGTFLTGAFDLAAAIWDREDATVRVAEQHDDFFVKNMVAILCEERLALTIYRTAAMVKGSLPATGT
jgi:HK97 family phage major capsid protein